MRSLAVLFLTLFFSLGCMGAVNSLTDLDLSVELEENAVHPADFPAREPASGKKAMSMGMTAGADSLNLPDGVEVDLSEGQKYRMELIAYEIERGDAAGLLATAKQQVEGDGYTLISEQDDVFTYEKDGVLFIIVDPAASDDDAFTLMRLKPVEEAAP